MPTWSPRRTRWPRPGRATRWGKRTCSRSVRCSPPGRPRRRRARSTRRSTGRSATGSWSNSGAHARVRRERRLRHHLEQRGGPAAPAMRRISLSTPRCAARARASSAAPRSPTTSACPATRSDPRRRSPIPIAPTCCAPPIAAPATVSDLALPRVLGDCGLRAGELQGLQAGDQRRPRSNARHMPGWPCTP